MPSALPALKKYFLAVNGQKAGEFSLPELQTAIREGRVPGDAQFWCEPMPNWAPLSELMSNPPPVPLRSQPKALKSVSPHAKREIQKALFGLAKSLVGLVIAAAVILLCENGNFQKSLESLIFKFESGNSSGGK